MVIEYQVSRYIEENKEIDIEDTKNVFLKGIDPYNGLNTYFGIWSNEECIVIATITSNRCISYEYSLDKSIYTENDIKKYLEKNNNVVAISKDTFVEQLQNDIF